MNRCWERERERERAIVADEKGKRRAKHTTKMYFLFQSISSFSFTSYSYGCLYFYVCLSLVQKSIFMPACLLYKNTFSRLFFACINIHLGTYIYRYIYIFFCLFFATFLCLSFSCMNIYCYRTCSLTIECVLSYYRMCLPFSCINMKLQTSTTIRSKNSNKIKVKSKKKRKNKYEVKNKGRRENPVCTRARRRRGTLHPKPYTLNPTP